MPLEGSFLLAKPALRPRMLLRALRPPMIFGASLPGMIFPAQRPAEGSNSYHYGSYATRLSCTVPRAGTAVSIPLWFLRNDQEIREEPLNCSRFHTTMVLTQPAHNVWMQETTKWCFHTTMVHTRAVLR